MSNKSYSELLLDPRWQRKRLEILNRSDFSCERCGSTDKTLHVHHKKYRKGAKPWEYENDQLEALCHSCHKSRHELASEIESMAALMDDGQLITVLGYMQAKLIGFEKDAEIKIRDGEHAIGVGDYYGIGYAGVLEAMDNGILFINDVVAKLDI